MQQLLLWLGLLELLSGLPGIIQVSRRALLFVVTLLACLRSRRVPTLPRGVSVVATVRRGGGVGGARASCHSASDTAAFSVNRPSRARSAPRVISASTPLASVRSLPAQFTREQKETSRRGGLDSGPAGGLESSGGAVALCVRNQRADECVPRQARTQRSSRAAS